MNLKYLINKKKNQCVQSEIFFLLNTVNISILPKFSMIILKYKYNWFFIFYIKGTSGVKPKKNFIQENKRYVTKLAKDTQSSKENLNPSKKLPCTNIQVNN